MLEFKLHITVWSGTTRRKRTDLILVMKIGAKSNCEVTPRSADRTSVHPEYLTSEQAGDVVTATTRSNKNKIDTYSWGRY